MKENVKELPATEVMFSKKKLFPYGKEKHDQEIIDLEDRSSRRRHLDQDRFRTDFALDENDCAKTEQPRQAGIKKPLPFVVATDLQRTHDRLEANSCSNVRRDENFVGETIKQNDESYERLDPPPIPFLVRRRGYQLIEGFAPRRPERICDKTQRVDIINQARM